MFNPDPEFHNQSDWVNFKKSFDDGDRASNQMLSVKKL